MNKINLKVISLVGMGLLSVYSLWNVFRYYQVKHSMATPLIPEYVVERIAHPYLATATLTAIAVATSFFFFLRSKYKTAMVICVGALAIILFVSPRIVLDL
jgi:hypothetical protein